MTLATRCPSCGTAFRVQPAQLAQRGGRVRCGKCATVFDGVAALDEPEAAPDSQAEPSPQLALFEISAPPSSSAAPASDPVAKDAAFLRDPEPAPRHRAAWAIGAALAAVLLVLQAAFVYRTELSVLFPSAREPLVAACRVLGCTVSWPRNADLMAIETSDLESDRRHDGVIVLDAQIRNRAPFPQEFPALELTLTDERDQPVLRRVLAPADYLSGTGVEQRANGLAAGAAASVRLHLHAGPLKPVGYRLYLFYP
jgi:predicted Zn finger-like uncharacterized protein